MRFSLLGKRFGSRNKAIGCTQLSRPKAEAYPIAPELKHTPAQVCWNRIALIQCRTMQNEWSVRPAHLQERIDGPEHRVRCLICERRCELADGQLGWCRTRENSSGMYATSNHLIAGCCPGCGERVAGVGLDWTE